MKTILVLTDFTKKAADAAKSAVIFGAKLHADLLLFNTYITAALVPQYAGGPWVIDEIMEHENLSKEKLKELAEELETDIAKLISEERKPTVRVLLGGGSLPVNVQEIIDDKDVELVVMGAHSDSSMAHILNGSDTRSVIDKSTRPVLIIPEKTRVDKIKKVVFATDFDEADMKAVHYLAKLAKLFDFKLEIVHITVQGKTDTAKNAYETAFLHQVGKIKYPHIAYQTIKGAYIIKRLNDYCEEEGADLLALVHYQDSFVVRLLRQSITKQALSNQKTPLLVFPSKMDEE